MVLAEDLRQAVLQAALQGKLTEQLDTDSNVDEMLESIHKEKEEWIVQKKIKKEKPLPKIQEKDVPFDIPDNWRWVRWGNLAYSIQYGYNAPAKEIGKIKMVRISDIQNNSVNWESVPYCDIKDEEIEIYLLHDNDILFARTGGTVGKSFLVNDIPVNAIYAGYLIRTRYSNQLIPKYLKLFMESQLYWVQLQNGKTQGCQPNCNGQTLSKMLIPIPPIEEQQRIVDKINEIMPKIDEYEKIEKELEAIKKEFPTNMKDALLQAAMQGKLTEQLESDSSVFSIIEQCEIDKEEAAKDGKCKKEKFRGALSEEEYPFDIPDNWEWLHISDMSLFQEGPGILAVDFRTQGVPLIRIAGMQEDTVRLNGCNYLDPQMVENKWKHFKLDLGDIVISTSASMDKIAEVTEETVGAIPYTGLIRFKMYGNINKEYFKYFIKSSFYVAQINEQKSGGTIKHYGPTHLKKMLIPIPPLEEQQRIVERLDTLLPLCEDLKED